MHTIRRGLLLAVSMLAVGAVAGSIAGFHASAIVALGFAGLAAFGWIVVWARDLQTELAGLRESSAVTANTLASIRSDIGRLRSRQRRTLDHTVWIRQQLVDDGRVIVNLRKLNERIVAEGNRSSKQMRSEFDRVGREVGRANANLQRLPATTIELSRKYRQLVHDDWFLPAADGQWALTAGTLVWLLNQIASGGVMRILECGSGASTVWFAAAFEHLGQGHVFALESDPAFAEQTRSDLARLGLGHRADVIDAPLRMSSVGGREPSPWYDLSGLPDDATDIDLLFVDGPVGALAPEVRYPAFPILAARLAAGAIVVLDDTIRPDEANIVATWLVEQHAGRCLERIGATDRATALRVMPSRLNADTSDFA